MSFPKYLTDIFRSNKSGKRPSASTVAKIESVKAQDAEFRRAMDNDRADSYTGLVNTPIPEDFRTQYSAPQIAPKPAPPSMATAPTQAAPPKPGSSAIQRGIAGFLGFVPQGGTRGDAADGWANIGRALMGEESVQKMESDYNQSIAPEKLRRALETGDVEAIKRLDPVVAGQVQGVDETTYTGGRQRQYDEAVAAGDIDAMRRLDPAKADERDIVRREGVTRAARAAAAIGGGDPAKTEAAFASFVDETPGLLSPQERSIYQQGGMPALQAMLVEPASGKDRFLSVAGGVYDMQVQDWVEQPTKPLTEMELADLAYKRAQTSNIYSEIANRGAADKETLATPEQKTDFTGSLNSIADTAVRLAKAGAIGVDGKGARTPIKSAIVGAKTKEGGQTFLGSVAQLMGDETAQIFSSRETQVDFAIRQFAAAAGIKSGSLNSNFELQNVKNALGNPFAPMEDQIAAADAMSLTYGDGTRTADYLLQSGQITQKQYDTISRRTVGFEGNIQRGVAQERASPSSGGDEIVSVQTPEEAMALEPGTQFRTPDGRIKVR